MAFLVKHTKEFLKYATNIISITLYNYKKINNKRLENKIYIQQKPHMEYKYKCTN